MNIELYAIIAAIIGVIVPIALVVIAYKKEMVGLKLLGIGALAFLLTNAILRLQFIEAIVVEGVIGIIIATIIVSLIDMMIRYVAMKYLIKGERSLKDGIGFGIGYGAMQEFLMTGIISILAIILMKANFTTDQANLTETLASFKVLVETHGASLLSQGILVPFSILLQVGLSTMVMKSLLDRSYQYLVYAIGFQVFITLMIRFMGMLNPLFADVMIALAGVFSGYMIYYIKQLSNND